MIASDHGILNMLFEIVDREVSHRGDTSLGIVGVSLLQSRLADEGDPTLMRHFERKHHTGQA